jgi:galactokinase
VDIRKTSVKIRSWPVSICDDIPDAFPNNILEPKDMNIEERKEMLAAAFEQRFGSRPTLWTRAPGRVDLMGSHTDYNMGHVMTMSIDRDTWIAGSPRDDGQVAIFSLNAEGGATFDLTDIQHDEEAPWTDYVRGVALAMQQAGYRLSGFNGLIHSTVPFSSGLSSSAALEMATGGMFKLVGGFDIDPVEMALLGQKAENQFVGVNSGILDQYSSTMGEAGSSLLLDCRYLRSRPVHIDPDWLVVICDTRAERSLTGSEYSDRRAQCEEGVAILAQSDFSIKALRDVSLTHLAQHQDRLSEVVERRCRFIIEEDQRVLDLADALPVGDADRLRELMAASYAGARDLYEIGVPAMESMMAAMMGGPGVVGARQAGAGFGGCMVAVVERDRVDEFAEHVRRSYEAETGIAPHVFAVEAAPGAGVL